MKEPIVVNTLEELIQFLNENGVLEIAIRGKNKRFKEFVKSKKQESPYRPSSGLSVPTS